MRAEISFKMRVVRPSEAVLSSSYDLFCVRFWAKKSTQISLTIVEKLFQIASRVVPREVQVALGVQFGLGNAFDAASDSKTPPILGAKIIQNPSGSNQKTKNICFRNQLWIRCRFLTDFWWNFEQFCTKMDSNSAQIEGSLVTCWIFKNVEKPFVFQWFWWIGSLMYHEMLNGKSS